MIDLNKLANEGGYGSHIEPLKKAGAWDEYAGLNLKEYRVGYDVSFNGFKTVKARHPDEAKELAENMMARTHECASCFVTITSVEAE